MGRRCLHVLKSKPSFTHVVGIHENVEGCGHGPLEIHSPTKESLTYKCRSSHVLKASLEGGGRFELEEEVVGGPGFEMGNS